MKKTIFLVALFAMSATCFCQPSTKSPPEVQTDYLKKSRNQKTAAWIMLGGGTLFSVTGMAIGMRHIWDYAFDEDNGGFTAGMVLFYAGAASMLGSIPLFIASGKNKRKAISVSLNNEFAPQIIHSSMAYRSVPSIKLKIPL